MVVYTPAGQAGDNSWLLLFEVDSQGQVEVVPCKADLASFYDDFPKISCSG
jgi:hypothetical protein